MSKPAALKDASHSYFIFFLSIAFYLSKVNEFLFYLYINSLFYEL
jgi:hypothetical protein